MNFSTNQVRHFYVANAENDLTVVNSKDGIFRYLQLAEGGRSDLMEVKKITHIEHTLAEELALTDRSKTITVNNPEEGKSYTAKVLLYNIFGAGDETSHPLVAVATYKGNAATFYAALATNLTNAVKNYKALTFEGTADGLTISTDLESYNEGWNKAYAPLNDVYFEIMVDKNEWEVPETFTAAAESAFVSGYKLAELEYFCMGERGDQYRMMGYPNHIETEYKIVPGTAYDVIDVEYFYNDTKEGVQKSNKVITIAAPNEIATTLVAALGGTAESAYTISTDDDFIVETEEEATE